MGRRTVDPQLVKLCTMLPGSLLNWAGESGVRMITLLQEGIRIFTGLRHISATLQNEQKRVPAQMGAFKRRSTWEQ